MSNLSKQPPENMTNNRYIIEKLFCHHDMKPIITIDVKNDKFHIVGVNSLLVCEKCGKTKVIRL